jgi:zinc transport system substrate-binding protein
VTGFRANLCLLYGIAAAAFVAGCENVGRSTDIAAPVAPSENAPVAVSSPYLEVALREIMGQDLPLVRLAGPTMCPGHYDVRPSQIRDLARCGLLIRFDFQQSLDAKFSQQPAGQRQTLAVRVSGGLCVPESYLSACRQIADHFVAAGSLGRRDADHRLARLGRRMAALGEMATRRIEAVGLRGAPVLAGGHQADFCRWLGLRVAGEMFAADTAGTSDIEQSVKDAQAAGVRIIVANEPEGRRAADALADHLHARVVVFGNFPSPDEEWPFDALVRRNIAALLAAAPPDVERP